MTWFGGKRRGKCTATCNQPTSHGRSNVDYELVVDSPLTVRQANTTAPPHRDTKSKSHTTLLLSSNPSATQLPTSRATITRTIPQRHVMHLDESATTSEPPSLQKILIAWLGERFSGICPDEVHASTSSWPRNVAAGTQLPGALACAIIPDHLSAQIYDASMHWRRLAAPQASHEDIRDGIHVAVSVPISIVRPFYKMSCITVLRFHNLTDSGASELTATHLPALRSLCVEHSPTLTDTAIASALASCASTIRSITFRNCALLSPNCLLAALEASNNALRVETLVVRACPAFIFSTRGQATSLFASDAIQRHLRHLGMDTYWAHESYQTQDCANEADVRASLALCVGRMESLTHLSVSGLSEMMCARLWWDEGMSMSELCSLDLSHCDLSAGSEYNEFVSSIPLLMPQLVNLDLSNTKASLSMVLSNVLPRHDDANSGCKHLRTLLLAGVVDSAPPLALTTSAFDTSSIVELSLARCAISAPLMWEFANTHTLDISGNRTVAIPNLSEYSSLRVLDISDCGCEYLPQLPQGLIELRCHDNNIVNEDGHESLWGLEHLRVLWIDGTVAGFTDPLHVVPDALDSGDLDLGNARKQHDALALNGVIKEFQAKLIISDTQVDDSVAEEEQRHHIRRVGIAKLQCLEVVHTVCDMRDNEIAALPFVFGRLRDVRVSGRGMEPSSGLVSQAASTPMRCAVECGQNAEDVVRMWLAVNRVDTSADCLEEHTQLGHEAEQCPPGLPRSVTMLAMTSLSRMGYSPHALGNEIEEMQLVAYQRLLQVVEVTDHHHMARFVASVAEMTSKDGVDQVMARGSSFEPLKQPIANEVARDTADVGLCRSRNSQQGKHGLARVQRADEWQSPVCCRCSVCVERAPGLYTNPFKVIYSRDELYSIHRRMRINARKVQDLVQHAEEGKCGGGENAKTPQEIIGQSTPFRKRSLRELAASSSSSAPASPWATPASTPVGWRARDTAGGRTLSWLARTSPCSDRGPDKSKLGGNELWHSSTKHSSRGTTRSGSGNGIPSSGGSTGEWR
jgi:hypothetical protein